MWALGIILYQLVSSLKHPFECEHAMAMLLAIKDKEPAPLPTTVSPQIKQIILRLLDKNPQSRPSAETLLDLPEI